MKQVINLIAARKSWDLKDYSIEARPHPEDSRPAALDQRFRAIAPARTQLAASPAVLDNPAFIAIREAVRNFCQDGVHEHLHVRQIQSSAEREDLWEINNAAYGEASITYEKFKNWWMSFPSGLSAVFFRTLLARDRDQLIERGLVERQLAYLMIPCARRFSEFHPNSANILVIARCPYVKWRTFAGLW
jgi:hypothetical protein